ncbi:MAG TPA: protein kinase [Solirubrobacterales bacterium]|nr:protein kinase [Solirubrobacterales bacterium]
MNATLISNRYALGDRLGSGGMSTVYRATDRVLERTVAVKVLAEHLSDDDKFVARFRREALAVAKLIHPNIVQVYDTGVDQGRHYIVMEYVEGRSVAQLLQSRGRLGPEVAVEVGTQACAGLEYAHRQGIIHRDVKPGNLMVIGGPAARPSRDDSSLDPPTGEMTVKLTDFGIARAAEQTRLTQVGSVVGTAAYLAPEQARGEEATPAADVYALGVVLYQVLAGRLPWEGSTLAELAIRRENERPLAPTSYDPEVPETLSRAVLRSLESEPERRYTTARDLALALRSGIAGREPAVPNEAATRALATDATRRLPPEAPAPAPGPRPTRPRPRPTAPPAARRSSVAGRITRAIGVLILIAALAGLIAAGVLLLTEAGQGTDVGEFLRDDVPNQINELRSLIEQNSE